MSVVEKMMIVVWEGGSVRAVVYGVCLLFVFLWVLLFSSSSLSLLLLVSSSTLLLRNVVVDVGVIGIVVDVVVVDIIVDVVVVVSSVLLSLSPSFLLLLMLLLFSLLAGKLAVGPQQRGGSVAVWPLIHMRYQLC